MTWKGAIAIVGIPLLLPLAGQAYADSAREYCLEQFPADYYSKDDHALYIKECIAEFQEPATQQAAQESPGSPEDAIEQEADQSDRDELEAQQD